MFKKLVRPSRVVLAACLLLALASAAAQVAGEEPPPNRPPWLVHLRLPDPGDLSLQEPAQIAVQGLLTAPLTGHPLPDGSYSLRLALYRAVSGGEPFWDETHEVNLENGVFDLLLGSVRDDLTPDLFYEPAYLGITLVGDSEMVPRHPLVPVPEALVARTLRPGAYWQAETSDPLLGLENDGSGVGIYAASAEGSAIVGQSTQTDTVGLSGLSAYGDGVGGFSSFGRGGYFASVTASGALGNSIMAGTAGLEGVSNAGVGVRGTSETGAGGHFSSTQSFGLYATADNPASPAVQGEHTGGGTGLVGSSITGYGVEGRSSANYGVYGTSDSGTGGFFRSTSAPALQAVSSSSNGAIAVNNVGAGAGLWAESLESHGVEGHGALSAGAYGGHFVGHGGVYAQGVGGPAVMAEGPIVSTSSTHLWIGGLVFRLEGGEGVTVIPQAGGGITLTATAPTTVHLYATLTVPAVLYGQPVSVSGLRVQYRTTDASSYIDETSLARGDGAGGSLPLVADGTDRAETAPGSFYEPPILGLGHEELTADGGAMGLQLTVRLGGEGKALAIYGARLTLVNRQGGG